MNLFDEAARPDESSAPRSSTPADPPPPVPHPNAPKVGDPDEPRGLRRRLRALGGDGDWLHRVPVKSLLVATLLVVAAISAARWTERSFQSVRPGEAGLALNKYTGRVKALPAGTHFLPTVLYDLSRVRISDRILDGDQAAFTLTTKDGLTVSVAVQARWSLDGSQIVAKWASLPDEPGKEVVLPVLVSAFRGLAPQYDATALLAEKREALAAEAAERARRSLAENGILLKEVLVGNVRLPDEYERGRLALLQESQSVDRKEATLRLKAKEIEQTKLEAEALKVKAEKQAETEASQKLIAAKAESEAMAYVLPLKEKEIRQKELEADAEKMRRLKEAQTDAEASKVKATAEAEASKIRSAADAERRRTMAEAEAYAIRQTTLAQFENLKREVELVQLNPVWVSKTFAEKLSPNVQVILTPRLDSGIFQDEAMKRLANGQQAVAPRPASSNAVATTASK